MGNIQEDEHTELFAAARAFCSDNFSDIIDNATRGTVWEGDSSKERSTARTAMGIKIIAYGIREDKQIVLWWD